MEKYNELNELVEGLKEDVSKFYEKQNKAAGVRVRVALQKVKAIAQDMRLEISSLKNK